MSFAFFYGPFCHGRLLTVTLFLIEHPCGLSEHDYRVCPCLRTWAVLSSWSCYVVESVSPCSLGKFLPDNLCLVKLFKAIQPIGDWRLILLMWAVLRSLSSFSLVACWGRSTGFYISG